MVVARSLVVGRRRVCELTHSPLAKKNPQLRRSSYQKGKNMENKTSPQTKETVGQTVEQVRQSSRRTFLTLAVAASGGAALWFLRKPSASAAAAERSVDAPSIVTVVKFSSSGANLGKETVPHIVKPDDEWKRQLSTISYEVARQAGTERP
jgi:hypothetical protein